MKRYKHNLSHYHLTTMDMGYAVPILCEEVLPGDSFRHNVSSFLRVAPLVNPVMHPVHVHTRSFFVPTRIIWSDFQDFITAGRVGTSAPTPPYISNSANVTPGSLENYLGLPIKNGFHAGSEPSALPFRAYNQIMNDYYLDQELAVPRTIDLTDGLDTTTTRTLQATNWNKDYFTTARPNAQKGPAIRIPTGLDTLSVELSATTGVPGEIKRASDHGVNAGVQALNNNSGNLSLSGVGDGVYDPNGTLEVDTTDMLGTIQELRLASALLRYEENRSRYGSRYTEYLRYLGVRSSDARLQRAEYLGGGRTTIQFSEVLQTAPTTDGDPEGIGNLFGHGAASAKSSRYMRFFEEHGFVITIMSIVPQTCYAQGVSKMWMRKTKESYYQKELEHVGQEEVRKDELYVAGTSADPETWGYTDRYQSYRTRVNRVSGEFADTEKTWTMYRDFSSLPTLNSDFVFANPTDRVYQASASLPSNYQIQAMVFHNLKARRIVSNNPTPLLY